MITKLFSILIVAISTIGMVGASSNEQKVFKWGTGVEVPIYYITKFPTGENGVLIEGVQYISKRSKVRYEMVKRGFWKDQVYDKFEVNHSGKFSSKMEAPKGEYQIKICGNNMAHGILKISPY